MGIFDDYADVDMQVSGVSRSEYKKYRTAADARRCFQLRNPDCEPLWYIRAEGWVPPAGYARGDSLPVPEPIQGVRLAILPVVTEVGEGVVESHQQVDAFMAHMEGEWRRTNVASGTGPLGASAQSVVPDAHADTPPGTRQPPGFGGDVGKVGGNPPAVPALGVTVPSMAAAHAGARADRERALRAMQEADDAANAREEAEMERALAESRREAEDEELRRRQDQEVEDLLVQARGGDGSETTASAQGDPWGGGVAADFIGVVENIEAAGRDPDEPDVDPRPFRETEGEAWIRTLTTIAGASQLGFYPAAIHALGEKPLFRRHELRDAVAQDLGRANAWYKQVAASMGGMGGVVGGSA